MAIKYYHNPEKKETYAVLRGTEMDAVHKIAKMMSCVDWCFCADKYMMPRTFKAKVRCAEDDVYTEEEGERRAKRKLLNKYYKCLDNKLVLFEKDMMTLNKRVFGDYEEKLDK